MKKRLGLVCITLLSISLLGFKDSANGKFNELAKQGIKDNKSDVWLYDFKDNKAYSYFYYQGTSLKVDEVEEKFITIFANTGFKYCTTDSKTMSKIALSDDSLTFSCIYSLKKMLQSQGIEQSEEESSGMNDRNINITIIGQYSTENAFIEEEKYAMTMAFNSKTLHVKDINDFSDRDEVLTMLKKSCNATQNGQYDGCLTQNSRLIVTGL